MKNDLSPIEENMLRLLLDKPGATTTEMGEGVGTSVSTAWYVVRRLRKSGNVANEGCRACGRAANFVTAKGKKALGLPAEEGTKSDG